MSDRPASRTALGVLALRAAHQRFDDPPHILDDPIAEALLDPPARERLLGERAAIDSPMARALRAHVVTRSRFAEDRLRASLDRRVRQYIVLGAGYDTFAYRQPAWAAALRIFEADQPGTQEDKRQRLAVARVDTPENLTFVPVDFERESLSAALAARGFDAGSPAFFSWLGVTMYLDGAANDGVFRFVASLPAGSELVFTFAPPAVTDDDARAVALGDRAAAVGEPWRTFYDPRALDAHLHSMGYSSVWMPTPAEIAAAYFLGRSDDLPLPRRRTIVAAIV